MGQTLQENLIKAIVASIMIIRTSQIRQINDPIPFIEPFLFCDDRSDESTFEYEYTYDGNRYIYSFSATKESLVVYKSQRPTKIFSRKEEIYNFYNAENAKVLEPLIERNTPNKLFLATAAAWNAEATKEAFLFFSEVIVVYDSERPDYRAFQMYEEDGNGLLKAFTTRLMKESDININDYTFETKKSELINPIVSKEYKILSKHNIKREDGSTVSYELPLPSESKGTQNLFFLSPQIKKALDNGYVFCVDELDSSMHPDLLRYLISIFNSEETNPKGAQLIVTLHSTEVMSLLYFRRDQIYFVDNDSGESELYSLAEFPVRFNEDVLSGRFGAVPHIIKP